jgi:hypothetical protein
MIVIGQVRRKLHRELLIWPACATSDHRLFSISYRVRQC